MTSSSGDTRSVGKLSRLGGRTHGTRSGYVGGCRCEECRAAAARYAKLVRARRAGLLAGGQGPDEARMVDGAVVAGHYRSLRTAGMSNMAIANAMGWASRGSLQAMLTAGQVSGPVADRFLAIRPGPSLVGVFRRVAGLMAMGWPVSVLADATGVSVDTIGRVVAGRGEYPVSEATRRAVVSVFDAWQMLPGPDPQLAATCRASGFVPPLGWDEDEIDDVDAPVRGAPAGPRRHGSTREDALELLSWGTPVDVAADRLGVSVAAVRKMLERDRAAKARARQAVGGAAPAQVDAEAS